MESLLPLQLVKLPVRVQLQLKQGGPRLPGGMHRVVNIDCAMGTDYGGIFQGIIAERNRCAQGWIERGKSEAVRKYSFLFKSRLSLLHQYWKNVLIRRVLWGEM